MQSSSIPEAIMTRRTAAAASAALAALACLCACTDSDASADDVSTTTPSSTPSSAQTTGPTAATDDPIDLMQVAEDTPLKGGSYAIGLLHDDGPDRAIVEVPAGYVGGGPVIGADEGDAAFWGKVDTVDTDPCLGGKHVDAGTSVHDLATMLASQRNMQTTKPVPVAVGGYHGVYLKSTAPADIDRCRQGSVTLYTADGGTWLQDDVAGGVFHTWILNVDGRRIVGGVRVFPNSDEAEGLMSVIESATFEIDG
jgi:hypothetical protein